MNTRFLKEAIKRGLLYSGQYRRKIKQVIFPGVAVLCYHGIRQDNLPKGRVPFDGLHVRVSELEAHCRFIRANCHPISLDDWRLALRNNTQLPMRPVLFTFDDGYRSVFSLALPILEKYAITPVIFVASAPVEERIYLWPDAVARVYGEVEVERLKESDYRTWQKMYLRHKRNVADDDPCACLKIDEIKILAEKPGLEIGSHTHRHVILSKMDPLQQLEEINKNKSSLESWIGRKVSAFAYPNGRPRLDYTLETVALLRQAGFDFAFTTGYGFATDKQDCLEKSRFIMTADISGSELAYRLCYSWHRLKA